MSLPVVSYRWRRRRLWTIAFRYVFSVTLDFLALLTHQGYKLLVQSFEFDDQRLQQRRLLE